MARKGGGDDSRAEAPAGVENVGKVIIGPHPGLVS